MANNSYVQASFHGGEWSKHYQGRTDHRRYKEAMNVCYNGLPIEEGSWVRRPGTRISAPTYKGNPGRIMPIAMEQNASYLIEFTDGNIRFHNGGIPVFTEEVTLVSTISTAEPAVMSTAQSVEWKNGDEIVLFFDNSTVDPSSSLILRQRILRITPITGSYPTWDSDTTFILNAIVIYSGNYYKSLIANNLGNQPDINPDKWELLASEPHNQFQLFDSITDEPINGAEVNFSGGTIFALRLLRITSPYINGTWANNRIVQYENTSFILNPEVQPQQFTISPNPGDALFARAEIKPVDFIDGPYLDPIPNSILIVSGQEGIITITAKFNTWSSTVAYTKDAYVDFNGQSYRSLINGNLNNNPSTSPTAWVKVPLGTAVTGEDVEIIGFQQGDVGRHIRFFSAPPQWTPSLPVAFGDSVFYNGQAFQNISGTSLVGVQPDTNPEQYRINPSGAGWVWGKIVNVLGPISAEVQIIPMPNTSEFDVGYKLLYPPTVPIPLWRLGVYSDAVGWPSAGCLHEGRLWLGGVIKNRFDASAIDISGKLTIFSPTLPDGTVTDASGISYTLLATDKNQIYWFSPEQAGIVCGTLAGEWLIQSSTSGDPLTPTSIQAKRVTKYGCANIEPKRMGMALVFVHKFLRKCFEFITDVWTNKYIAPNLSEKAKHITAPGIQELAYQEELAPVLWCRLGDGTFAGTTYRRQNSATIDEPTFNGWHRHKLGTNRTVEYITGSPSADGKRDTISFLTNDPDFATSAKINKEIRWVEVMTDIFETDTSIYDAWFVDGGMVPASMYEDTVNGQPGIRFTGLWYLRGNTVAVWAGGLDVGNYLVEDNGTVFVPYGSGVAPALIDYTQPGAGHYMFTASYINSIKSLNFVPRNGGIFTGNSGGSFEMGQPNEIGTTTTIQEFKPANAFAGESLSGSGPSVFAAEVFPDWRTKHISINGGTGPEWGIRTWNMTTGTQIAHATWLSITGFNARPDVGCVLRTLDDIDPMLAFVTDVNGVATSSNYDALVLVDQKTLVLDQAVARTSIVGGTGTGESALTATGVPALPSFLAGGTGQGHNLLIEGATSRRVALIDPDGILLAGGSLTQGVGASAMMMEGLVKEGGIGGAPIFGDITASTGSLGIHLTAFNGNNDVFFGYYGIWHTIIQPVQGSYLGHQMDLNSKKDKGKKKFSIDETDLFGPSQEGENKRDLRKIGDIFATQVHSAWTGGFSRVGGCIQDATDGGLIVEVETATTLAPDWSSSTSYVVGDKVRSPTDDQIYECIQAHTNQDPAYNGKPLYWRYSDLQKRYLIKLAAQAPTILWKVPINKFDTSPNNITSAGQCNAGILIYIGTQRENPTGDPIFPVYIIDTIGGSYKVGKLKGVDGIQDQCSNGDNYQVVVGLNKYTSAINGAPQPLNSTASFDMLGGTRVCLITFGNDLETSTGIPSLANDFPKPRPIIRRIGTSTGQFPCAVGFPFVSQGQILRIVDQQEQKSPLGSGVAKVRRAHYIGALLVNANGIEFGTDFSKMDLAIIRDEFGKQITPDKLFTGAYRHTVRDGYSFDSMLAWQIQRPYPATVANIGGFSKVNES